MAKGGTPKSGIPKYTIRVALIWFIPVLSILFRYALVVPFLLAAILTPIEVPKVRQQLFGVRTRKQLPCLRVPALMRLSVLWVLQAWWLLLWRAESSMSSLNPSEGSGVDSSADAVGETDGAESSVAWQPRSMSVVLPCAGEGDFAFKTVRSVYETTPESILHEIIVVDDGSEPPLETSHLTEQVRSRYRVRLIRHADTVGLIGSKKDGGDAAAGDIVVFFDCHVAPQRGWHNSFLRLIGENYRRIVTPVITDLDVGSWKQRRGRQGQAKCYLTWDADFKWFESDDPYVPVLSGGLLGISKRWWNETGGYDEQMIGWGGENLDQSLRSWLCGGEIMMAQDSFVAHMWRVPNDPRTAAKYRVKAGAAITNRMRAAVAWFGEFSEKLASFPALTSGHQATDGMPWYGDIGNILEVRERLQCRSFAWFMHRFKHVYEDGGLIPSETFGIRTASSGMCLTYVGQAGTSPNGYGKAVLEPCKAGNDRQRWHGANRDTSRPGRPCCSGLRAWNTDQCIVGGTQGTAVKTFICEISGRRQDQAWQFTSDGRLQLGVSRLFMRGQCLEPDAHSNIEVTACPAVGRPASWVKDNPEEPAESLLYRKAMERLQV
uniref:Polypeptide N-acetylgalactosaminyltransferase n=1 Tax=Pyrodinium bahamense TaxID=73915 RepID=A0A7S0AL75_9DINO|mmetsp:Transcript_3706/g.10202  ORF Transcript_3706/g.10202 Transcript_3706/m.10202 type:complete len:604 (+) Transcript_3706:152-1963(+)